MKKTMKLNLLIPMGEAEANEKVSNFLNSVGVGGTPPIFNHMNKPAETKEEPKKEEPKPEAKAEKKEEPKKEEPTKDAEEEEEEEGDGEEEQEEIEDFEIETPLFGKKKVSSKKEKLPEFKDTEEINKYIKEKFGSEKLDDFLKEAETWKQTSEQLPEIQTRAEKMQKALEVLPDELYSAAMEFWNNGDWKSELTSSLAFDYSKDVDDIKPDALVSKYFPGDFEPTDFQKTIKDEDGEDVPNPNYKATQIAIREAKNKFKAEQKAYKSKRDNISKQQDEFRTKYTETAKTAMVELDKKFPDLPKHVKEKTEKALLSNTFTNKFYNSDGTLTKDAAIALTMAELGADTIAALMKAVEAKGVTKAREKDVAKGKKEPSNNPKSSGSPKAKSKTDEKVAEFMKKTGLAELKPAFKY